MTTDLATDHAADERAFPVRGLVVLAGVVSVLVLLPVAWMVLAGARVVGAGRALDILLRGTTLRIILNSLVMTAAVTAASILLGVPLAYLTTRTDVPLRRVLTVALAMPLVVPSYIGAFAFSSAFAPRGEVQSLLAPLGVESTPGIYGLPGAVLVITLYTYPYVFITTRAALKSLDTRLVEAARTLRHSRCSRGRSTSSSTPSAATRQRCCRSCSSSSRSGYWRSNAGTAAASA